MRTKLGALTRAAWLGALMATIMATLFFAGIVSPPAASAAKYCGTAQNPEPCDPPEPSDDNGGTALPSEPNPGPTPTMLSAARAQAKELDDPSGIPQDFSDFDLGNLKTLLDTDPDPWYERFTPPAWPLLWSTGFAQRQLRLKYDGSSLQPDGIGKAIFYKSPSGDLRPSYPYQALLVPAEGEPTYPTIGVPYRYFLVTDYQPSTPLVGRNATVEWGDGTAQAITLDDARQVGYYLPGFFDGQKVLQLHSARVIPLEHTYQDPQHFGSFWARPTITIDDDIYTEVEYTSTMSDSQRQVLQYFGSACDAALKVVSIYMAVAGAVDPYSSMGAGIVGTATGMTSQQIASLAQVLNTYSLYSTGSSVVEDMMGMYSSGGMCTNASTFLAAKFFGVGFESQEYQYKPTFVLRSPLGQVPANESWTFGKTLKKFGGSPDGGIHVHAATAPGGDPFARPSDFSSTDPNYAALRLAQKRYSDIKTGTPYYGMWDDDTVVVESIWADMQQHPLPPMDQSRDDKVLKTRVEDMSRTTSKICPDDTVRASRTIAGSHSGVTSTWMGPEGEDIGEGTSQPVHQSISVAESQPLVTTALRASAPGSYSVTFEALSPSGTRFESDRAYFDVEDPQSPDCQSARAPADAERWVLDLSYETTSTPMLGVDRYNVTARPKLRRDVQLTVCEKWEPLPPKIDPNDPDPPDRECLMWGTEDHSYDVAVSSLEGRVSFEAEGTLPAGFTLDVRTGVMSGTTPSDAVAPAKIAAVVRNVRTAAASVDLTAPEVTIDSPDSVEQGASLAVTFGATDASGVASLTATFDGSAIKSGSAVDRSLLGVGTHVIRVVATDGAGLVRATRQSIEVRADTTGPQVRLDVPEKVAAGESFLIQFGATDTGTGVASVKAAFDDEEIAPESWIPSEAVTPGSHKITVTAVDQVGNATTESREVVVPRPDTTAPEIKVDAPDRVVWPLPLVVGFDASDADSGVDSVRATFDDHEIGSGKAVPSELACPGEHVLRVRAVDGAGNEAVVERHIAVEDTDHTAPRIDLKIDAPQPIMPNSTVVVAFSAEDDLTGVAELAGTFDAKAIEAGRAVPAELVTVGEHIVAVTAADAAGNRAEEKRTIKVEAPEPPPTPADSFEFAFDGGLKVVGSGPLVSGSITSTSSAIWGSGTVPTPAGTASFAFSIRYVLNTLPVGSVVTNVPGVGAVSTPVLFRGVTKPVCGSVAGTLTGWRWTGKAFAPYSLRFKATDIQRAC